MTYDCAWKLDAGRDVRLEISMIKANATETAWTIVDRAMQLHGAMGMTRELPLHIIVMTALADAVAAPSADDNCRAVVLTTAGKVFCGGADLAPAGLLGGGEAGLAAFYEQAARLFGTRKPIGATV